MFEEKIAKFSTEVKTMFESVAGLVMQAAPNAEARMWAGLPSFYVGEAFVRVIPFKDHLNIEAAALLNYKEQLDGYKFTSKNMLQIFVGQPVPSNILIEAIAKTLIK